MSAVHEQLGRILAGMAPVAVAVSGGVDSMTLASVAGATLGTGTMVAVHAISPAVPSEATARVRSLAAEKNWALHVVAAGEFDDPDYRANPVNRCFFCKTNLYAAIAAVTPWQIVSGANLDDLGEYRPGLDAARRHGVRHPFVEAGMSKAAVRALARDLGLVGIADLPAAPCLASRLETGIRVESDLLAFVHAVESLVGSAFRAGTGARTVRCRLRATGIVVELDPESLSALDERSREALRHEIVAMAPGAYADGLVRFAPYRNGSAFLHGRELAMPA